jgi:uncharacterized membrane protein
MMQRDLDRPAASAACPDELRPPRREWRLCRNCALTPRQLFVSFGCTCAVNLLIGAVFWSLGYPLVALFVAIEMGALAAALLCYARHASDGERITLQDGRLTIERQSGGRIDRFDLPAHWARVMATPDCRSFVVSAGGRTLPLGQQAPISRRRAVAEELRTALRQPTL